MQGCLISAFIYLLVIDSSSPWRVGVGAWVRDGIAQHIW